MLFFSLFKTLVNHEITVEVSTQRGRSARASQTANTAQKRPADPRHSQVGGPVHEHQAGKRDHRGGGQIPASDGGARPVHSRLGRAIRASAARSRGHHLAGGRHSTGGSVPLG
jgi:hypothetical protein